MPEQIIVIDKVEEADYQGKKYRKVTDKGGKGWNIKSGQGGKLEEKWPLLEAGKAIKLTMGEYQGKPYVQDIELVSNVFEQKAAEKVADQTGNNKDRSMCLSYAKDLAVADRIKVNDIPSKAAEFYQYVTTGKVESTLYIDLNIFTELLKDSAKKTAILKHVQDLYKVSITTIDLIAKLTKEQQEEVMKFAGELK